MTTITVDRREARASRALNVQGAVSIWQRELVRFFRERWRAVTTLVQPLLYLLVFGTGLGRAVDEDVVAGDFRVFLLPGVIVMTVLFSSMFSGMSIVWDREFGFLKEILVAPLGRAAVIAGKVAGGATTATMQGLAILILAPLVGLRLNPLRVVAVAPVLLLFALAVNSLGIAIAARISTMQGFMVIMNFITLPLFFLSGALFPLNSAPVWLRTLSYLDPAAYAVDCIRRVLLGFPAAMRFGGDPVPIAVELGALAVFGMIMFAVATRGFERQP